MLGNDKRIWEAEALWVGGNDILAKVVTDVIRDSSFGAHRQRCKN